MSEIQNRSWSGALNKRARQLADAMILRADALRLSNRDDGTGVPMLDCGIDVPGSLEAGLAMAEVCMAGLGTVDMKWGLGDWWTGPAISVRSDHPVAACMLSQYAGWQIANDGFFAMGSGPMRAAAAKEELFSQLKYRESVRTAVGILETRQLPPTEVAAQIADDCEVQTRELLLLVAPTGSIAGTIQVVARSVETALHKLWELGFDLSRVISAAGIAPFPPISSDDLQCIGHTNDAVLYGSHVQLWVTGDDDSLRQIVPQVPSSSSNDHGMPFARIFARYDHDFYKIDPLLFSPAKITVNNLETGTVISAGKVCPDVLHASFGG